MEISDNNCVICLSSLSDENDENNIFNLECRSQIFTQNV